MDKLNRLEQSTADRVATFVFVMAAAAVAVAVFMAGQGHAAPTRKAAKTSHLRGADEFKRPKLRHGVLAVEGMEASDQIVLRLQAGTPETLEVDVGDDGSADFSFKRSRIAEIDVDAGGGNDFVRMDEGNGAFTNTIRTTIDGGDGNDVLLGGSGAETLVGGAGADSLDGNGGNDRALMGAGDDTFVWDPGDGSDTVEGDAGADAMVFNGAGVAERVSLSPNGSRLRFLRDPGTITMDTAGVERVDFNALGGADIVTVDDLTGTDVSAVNLDLGRLDGQSDQVTVDGTDGDDTIDVGGDASGVAVSGLRALVSVRDQESTDQLLVDGRGGNDTISAAALAAGAIGLTIEGGAGDDTLAGAKGVETLLGGGGNDSADGNGGNDRAELGAGDDTFVWDPGDGSDVVEGQDGADTMLFNGAGGDEQVDLSANGSRLRFFRNPGTITMDTAGIERVDFIALGGADVVTINDLAGTDVSSVNVDLAGTPGGNAGDNKPDRVLVNGTDDDDAITVSGDANSVTVKGLAPAIGILHAQAENDTLEIATLAGNDSVDPAGLAAGAIQLFVDGALVP
jgi:Ca2+-binding RTX toxin-like protein